MSQRPVAAPSDSDGQQADRDTTLPPINAGSQNEASDVSLHEERALMARPARPNAQHTPEHNHSTRSADAQTLSSTPRGLGVHNILNPTETEDVRRSPVYPTTSSPKTEGAVAGGTIIPPLTRALLPNEALASPHLHHKEELNQPKPRKVLAAKSPRSLSLGGGGTGVFLQSTKPLPAGLEATQPYTPAHGNYVARDNPPLPSLLQQSQYGFSFLPPVSGPSMDRRRSSATTGPSRLSQSQNTSPATLYSAHSNQPSPAQPQHRPQDAYSGSQFHHQSLEGPRMGGLRPSQPAVKQEEGPYMTPPYGNFGMQGNAAGNLPMGREGISVPVDRVSGSRSADEKRKHNAAASSRFRERRKKQNEELKAENEKYEKENKDLQQQLLRTEEKLTQAESELRWLREEYRRGSNSSGNGGMPQPSPTQLPHQGIAYGQPPARTGPRPSDDEERPARRRRTQGPEQGDYFTLPPTTTNASAPTPYVPRAHERPSHQGPWPSHQTPGPMNAPPLMPRSPYINYPPRTNGSGSYHSQTGEPLTPGSYGFPAQPPPPPPPPPS